MIYIEIETDNAAFAGDPNIEVGRILHHFADQISSGCHELDEDKISAHPLMDINGNRVGRVWEVRS